MEAVHRLKPPLGLLSRSHKVPFLNSQGSRCGSGSGGGVLLLTLRTCARSTSAWKFDAGLGLGKQLLSGFWGANDGRSAFMAKPWNAMGLGRLSQRSLFDDGSGRWYSRRASDWAKRRWVALATGQREDMEDSGRNTRAAIFWDLDNKPPGDVPPLDAALRLKDLAANFGQVVDFMAYANRHAFEWVPEWVREERREAKQVEMLERRGITMSEEPHVCGMCGRKFNTSFELKKHFKQLHERERQKRVNYLKQIKSPKRAKKFIERNRERDGRYLDAARNVITPKRGYGLMSDLRRAGVHVRQVSDKPQAADIELMRDMDQAIASGMVDAICLVSDDRGYTDILNRARYRKLCVVVIGSKSSLKKSADLWFSWDDIASGKAIVASRLAISRWASENSREEEEEDDDMAFVEENEDEETESENYSIRRKRFYRTRPEVVDEAEWYEISDPPRPTRSTKVLQIPSFDKRDSSKPETDEIWEQKAVLNDGDKFPNFKPKNRRFDDYFDDDHDTVSSDGSSDDKDSRIYHDGWGVEDDDFFKQGRSIFK